MISLFTLIVLAVLQESPTPVAGSISGVVVNASDEMSPVPGAEIVLSVQLENELVVAAEGFADQDGRFLFDDIPADSEYIYLPGANLDGVHYPGSRISLTQAKPHARVNLVVHDTVSDPNPLVIRRHDITFHRESGAIRVTEKLWVENPSSRTYVGHAEREGGRAATLRLSIPSDFRRTTFDQEFYGSQFTLFEDRLVTDIPWTPGKRGFAFTYVLPNDAEHQSWRRPMDLPCDQLRVTVFTEAPEDISCNLPRAGSQTAGAVCFESDGQTLPVGYEVLVGLQRPPLTLAAYGRWLALALLAGLITVASVVGTQYRRNRNTNERDQSRAKHAKMG